MTSKSLLQCNLQGSDHSTDLGVERALGDVMQTIWSSIMLACNLNGMVVWDIVAACLGRY